MPSYHKSTPIRDWTNCNRCQLHSTRRNVVLRRSGLVHKRIYHITIDPPFPQHLRQLAIQGITNAHPQRNYSNNSTSTRNSTNRNSLLKIYNFSSENISNKLITTIPYILFIGEAPGEVEDLTSLPFWGPSGNLLDHYLLPLPDPSYNLPPFFFTITNTVCCRPTKLTPYQGTTKIINRQPLPIEQDHCRPHILELLQSYHFNAIITLGEIATNYLNQSLPPPQGNLPTLALTHPSHLLREDYILLPLKKEKRKLCQFLKNLTQPHISKVK